MPSTNDEAVANSVIHSALRRDLARTATVLEQPQYDAPRAALCEHLIWMLDYLHHHHVGEDEGLWPLVLSKDPGAKDLLDAMQSEHEALAAAADALRAAVKAYALDGGDDTRQALSAAVDTMMAVTLPHLDHEEREAMPVVLAALDHDDWRYLQKNYFRKGYSLGDVGGILAWWLDDLDSERAAVIRRQVPAPLLWILGRTHGGRYDNAAALRWGNLAGTRS